MDRGKLGIVGKLVTVREKEKLFDSRGGIQLVSFWLIANSGPGSVLPWLGARLCFLFISCLFLINKTILILVRNKLVLSLRETRVHANQNGNKIGCY